MVLGQLGIHMHKNKMRHVHHTQKLTQNEPYLSVGLYLKNS